MATFEYVEFPADAIRLKQTTCEPATTIRTELPAETQKQANESKSTLAFVPQLLLNAPLNSRQQPHADLLSTRDPLSVLVMTANFRRFVSKVGPVFWLQDRIEEIVLWKKGWKRTTVWMAAYAFFCYFPRMALLIPHIVLLGLMLYYHPDPDTPPVQVNVGESLVDWQANIQAIQNLMGAFSDAHDAIVPLFPFLLPPSQPKSLLISKPSQRTSDAVPPATDSIQPHHPLLIATLLSFLLLLPLLMTELLPLRLLFFLAGAGTVAALHPRIRSPLSNTILPALSGTGPGISLTLSIVPPRIPAPLLSFLHLSLPRTPTFTFTFTLAPRDVYLFFRRLVDDDRLEDPVWRAPQAQVELWENERWVRDATEMKRRRSVVVSFTREGEEEVARQEEGASSSGAPSAFIEGPKAPGSAGGTWSKTNLRPTERVGWTRGRDGWSGVGGEVSSNLTFSLSPGWAFIETESWRPDLVASWAVVEDASERSGTGVRTSVCEGADPDGWTYTTDTWTHPRPDGRPREGWVTRRRRWVRRVYFNGDT